MSVRVRLAKGLGPTAAELVADVVNELSDVDVYAVSIVNKGANRKRYFLRRSGDEPTSEELIDSPAPSELIVKGEAGGEWSAVYCVVAEPGWLEDAGMHGDQAMADRWASEDEIRKAAHKFMRNGGLVNRMHESLEPYGALVENAVALADFTVESPDGESHVIRKGSWYIAFEPNDEGRKAIESGEFTGVSIEGTGVRRPVAKGSRDGDGDGFVDDGLPTQRPVSPLPDLPRRSWTPEVGRDGLYHVYHGTSASRAKQIREAGALKVGRRDLTLTTSRAQAERYGAAYAADGDPVEVVHFAIPARDAARFLQRPEAHDVYGEKANAHSLRHDLPTGYTPTGRPAGGQVANPATDELGDRRRDKAAARGALDEVNRDIADVEGRLANPADLTDAEKTSLRARSIRLHRARNELRSQLRKREQFTKPGIANVSPKDLKTLAPLLRHYAAKAHPFRTCYRDQVKHGLEPEHAKRRCGVLKTLIRGGAGGHVAKVRVRKGVDGKGDAPWSLECGPALDRAEQALAAAQTAERDTVNKGMRNFLRKLGEKAGLSDDELALIDEDDEPAVIEKARPTFAERMAQRDFEDELPQAFDVLRSAVWSAFYPDPNEGDDRSPAALIEQSLDEFKAWASDLLASTDIAKVAESIEKSGGQTGFGATVADEMNDAEREQIVNEVADKLSASLPGAIAKAMDERENADDGKGGEPEPTVADLAKSVEKLTSRVEALGAGGSTQREGEPVAKGAGDQDWAGIL